MLAGVSTLCSVPADVTYIVHLPGQKHLMVFTCGHTRCYEPVCTSGEATVDSTSMVGYIYRKCDRCMLRDRYGAKVDEAHI